MSTPADAALARRFLHVCYCCADAVPVVAFLTDGLGLRTTMRTPVERGSGAILGLGGGIVSGAAFVYDRRGPRAGPGLEVQTWADPPVVGAPPSDPTRAGMQAIGFAVPDVDRATRRLLGLACEPVDAHGPLPLASDSATVRDPTGVTLDLVGAGGVPDGEAWLRHVRITVSDLGRSLPWYETLGFTCVGRASFDTGELVHLRLPDEAFEAVLVQYEGTTPSHGRHPDAPNHAGLFRTAVCVDDTRAAHAELRGAGVAFERPPMAVELRGTPVPDMWICFLRDPDGVPFELVERPRAAFATTT